MKDKTLYIIIATLYIIIATLLIVLAAMAIHLAADERQLAHTAELYPMTTVVIEVDYDTDTVTCEDFNGRQWRFFGCEDWLEGDIASLVMDKHGTPGIEDDTIVRAKYDGWLEDWLDRVCRAGE